MSRRLERRNHHGNDYRHRGQYCDNGQSDRIYSNSFTCGQFDLGRVWPCYCNFGVVLLSASIGFQTTLGVPNVVFTLYRDGQPIFNMGSSGLALLAIQPITIAYMDRSVPAGYHAYSLGVANNSLNVLLNAASVTGPVTFSGTSIG